MLYSTSMRKVLIYNPQGEVMWEEAVSGDETAAWKRAETLDKHWGSEMRIELTEETTYIDSLGDFQRGKSAEQQMREREAEFHREARMTNY